MHATAKQWILFPVKLHALKVLLKIQFNLFRNLFLAWNKSKCKKVARKKKKEKIGPQEKKQIITLEIVSISLIKKRASYLIFDSSIIIKEIINSNPKTFISLKNNFIHISSLDTKFFQKNNKKIDFVHLSSLFSFISL